MLYNKVLFVREKLRTSKECEAQRHFRRLRSLAWDFLLLLRPYFVAVNTNVPEIGVDLITEINWN